jgi:hypothetical protein
MATHGTSAEENSETPPVACSLSAAGLAAHLDRWHRLASRAMTERAETADGVRVRFRAGPGVEEELRGLVGVENECCSWADWTVQASPGQVMLDVTSDGDGIAALHGMFSGLLPAPAAGCGGAWVGATGCSGLRHEGRRRLRPMS